MTTTIRTAVIEPPFVPYDRPDDPSVLNQIAAMPRYLLYYGSIYRLKEADVLATALPPLLDQIPDLRMVLAGKCTDEAGRRLVALEARYADWVRYLGVLPATQLQPIVHGAAAVVLLSLVDNLPNTCLESMAAGRVVIGTRGASFEQLIENGRSGFLVPLGDAAALQLAMARAWHMGDAERAQMGSAAKGRIAQLRPDIAVARLESFYTAVIAGSRTARRESVVAH